jgi:hypothetical protein
MFLIDQPAPTPDAAGAAKALSLCSDQLVVEIGKWLFRSRSAG